MPISKITATSVADNTLTTDQFSANAVHGVRNLIINGAMQVAQRSTSAVTGLTETDDGYKTVDRWKYIPSGTVNTGQITMSYEEDAPKDFKYSTKYLVTVADTDMSTTGALRLETHLEAQNLRHLNYGSSDAQQVTLSFWVKSNKTGSYSAGLYMDSVTGDKEASQAYTINSADTWEYKALTFSANTSTTMNPIDNDHGLRAWFHQAAGSNFTGGASNTWGDSSHRAVGQSVNLYDTVNNYWQITGIQLEVGEQATPFEHRSYADELARCQRYYKEWSGNIETAGRTKNGTTTCNFALEMRATPTVTFGTAYAYRNNTGYQITAIVANSSQGNLATTHTSFSSTNSGAAASLFLANLKVDAEL